MEPRCGCSCSGAIAAVESSNCNASALGADERTSCIEVLSPSKSCFDDDKSLAIKGSSLYPEIRIRILPKSSSSKNLSAAMMSINSVIVLMSFLVTTTQ